MTLSPQPVELPPAVEVLGLPIRPLRTDGLIELLAQRARIGLKTTACYANAHTANMAIHDESFRRTLSESEILYADGASVVWASRYASEKLPERMTSADYFPKFARRCADLGLSLYFLGGIDGIAQAASDRLTKDIPHLRIVGHHHGHFALDCSDEIVADINASGADVLVVGMSSPRQELWLARHAGKISTPVRWCVGALFDYLAGVERRAPAWMCRIGGEWLFRLLVDPIGKWRRYILGNPLFVWNTMKWRFTRKRPTSAPTEALKLTRG